MFTATLAPTALTASTPTVHGSLAHTSYLAGCDIESEPHTELAHELNELFEGSYTPHALAYALREVQPQVLLIEMEEGNTLRTDYPTLAEATLEEVEYYALRFTTQATCPAE
jgi:hypothetical protein